HLQLCCACYAEFFRHARPESTWMLRATTPEPLPLFFPQRRWLLSVSHHTSFPGLQYLVPGNPQVGWVRTEFHTANLPSAYGGATSPSILPRILFVALAHPSQVIPTLNTVV
ncbi:unnamed protein product, partial [Ectocarpus fasciculatus]